MNRVPLDIDVVPDVLADREPFADDAAALLQLVERQVIEGLVAGHTITTLHFLLVKHLGKARARRVLGDLLHIVRVVPVDEDRLRHALALNWADFEDAVQASCTDTDHPRQEGLQEVSGKKPSRLRSSWRWSARQGGASRTTVRPLPLTPSDLCWRAPLRSEPTRGRWLPPSNALQHAFRPTGTAQSGAERQATQPHRS